MNFELSLASYNLIFTYDNEYLLIKVFERTNEDKKYKEIKIQFEDNNNESLSFEQFDKIIKAVEQNPNLIKIDTTNNGKIYLSLPIEENQRTLKKEIIYLNVKYYLTIGPDNTRINDKPFYSYLEGKNFNIYTILELLAKEKLDDIYDIDSYKMKNKEGYYTKIGNENHEFESELELEFHCIKKKDKYPLIKEIPNDKQYTKDIINLYKKINKYSQNSLNYDIIYLYASPILSGETEEKSPISYREEIDIILNTIKRKKKKLFCLFECMTINVLRDILITKKTKVLHISSHGTLKLKKEKSKDNNDTEYTLIMEDLGKKNFGQRQEYEENAIKALLKCVSQKIKNIELIILSTCYSGGLEELFSEYNPKSIIYVDKYTEIGDYTSVKFTKYFYEELINDRPIPECYETAIKKLKLDSDILSYNIDRCCCQHFHTCKNHIDEKETKMTNSDFHKNFHKKSNDCICKYEECNIHSKNCNLVSKMKEQKDEKLIVKDLGDVVKICCCNPDISHNEILKIKFKSRQNGLDKIIINNKKIFKYNIKGDYQINHNVSTDFKGKKYYSIIGRKSTVREIYNYISQNTNDPYIIVLYGKKGLRKRDFAESTCVHLLERKIIYKYDKFAISSDLDYIQMKEYIKKNEKENSINKYVNIIKFLTIEKPRDLEKKIEKINKDFENHKNLYFIILFDTVSEPPDINIDNIDNTGLCNAKIKVPIRLVKYYCYQIYNHYNCYENTSLNTELSNINPTIKYLEKVAKLIAIEKKTLDEIFKIIKNENFLKMEKQYTLILTKRNKDIYIKYYFLSKFPSGLPDSFISIIFDKNKKNAFNDDLAETKIRVDKKNDWKFIEKNNIFLDVNNNHIDMLIYAKKYIIKAIKLYAIILEHYINKNRNDVNFKDYNIHIVCNSYSTEELWKNKVKELSEKEDLNFDDNINFLDKDFDIMKHKENISNIILLIINNFERFITNDDNIENNIVDYIEEILLLFPSALFLKKTCKNILLICKGFCQRFIEFFQKNQRYNCFEKRFNRLMDKISLFQYSIGEINQLEVSFTNDEDIKTEMELLKFLKDFEKKDEGFLKEIKKKINDNRKISLMYYEFAKKYFSNNFKVSKEHLKNAIKNMILFITNEHNEGEFSILLQKFIEKFNQREINLTKYDLEVKYLLRMCFDYFHTFKTDELNNIKNTYSKIEEIIEYLNQIFSNNRNSTYFNYKEGINLKYELYNLIQPDIIMLNSNPIKNQKKDLTYSYLNNQYHILKKIKDLNKEEMQFSIRIKSNVLDSKNLNDALNKKGEILIIQSDYFSEDGDIYLETKMGSSVLLRKEQFISKIPVKIGFKLIILCFNNSSKFIEAFKDVDNLIYFKKFDSNKMYSKDIVEYNKACVEFIIDFIKISSKENNIPVIFNKAKKNFDNNVKLILGNKYIKKDYICLKIKDKDQEEKKKLDYLEQKSEIFLYEPLPNIIDNYESENYSNEISNIIFKLMDNQRHKILSCCKNKKNRFIKIGFEIIKYFHRHHTFINYLSFDMNKISVSTLKNELKYSENEQKNIFGENNFNERLYYKFYFVYNCKEQMTKEIMYFDNEYNNNYMDFFLILQDIEHKDGKCKCYFA